MPSLHVVRWCAAGLLGAGLLGGNGRLVADPPKPVAQKPENAPRPKPVPDVELPPSPATLLDPQTAPIDLASALKLAGVQNAEILLARERVVEAVAEHQLAAAQILPSLNAGLNVDTHTGPLQRAVGVIQKVNRGSLYLGLGANAVGAGTVNIPGLVWSGNVSQGIYGRLITRQIVREREFTDAAVHNDVLLQVADAYVSLLQAEGRRAIAVQARDDSREVARITANFARPGVGEGRQADADRAATDLEQREAEIVEAENQELIASARLCQLLDLDPSVRLTATDSCVVPAPIVPDPIPLLELIAIALTQRPELGERRAAIREALLALDAAKVLPFSPNVIVGFSAGSFGGGSNLVAEGAVGPPDSRFGNFGSRTDFDAVVYWTARNLGVGNLAMVRLAQSNVRTNNLREVVVLDRVRMEVATAYARTHARFAQIETSERAVRTGERAFQEDLVRTKNKEGRPIEVLDSLRLLRTSRYALLDAISDYNRAQFELYAALGKPPADCLARPVPADFVPSASPPKQLPSPK